MKKAKFTREMKRKLKNKANNIYERLGIIINHAFPDLFKWYESKIKDPRHQSYINYDMKTILTTPLIGFCCDIQSMNSLNERFNDQNVFDNINKLLGTDYEELPQKDTIMNVLKKINHKDLEKIQVAMIKTLIKSKSLDQFKHFGLWHIVIDATQLYSTLDNLGPKALTKTYNKGKEDEYTLYFYDVLEAKLVCGNNVFSICSEFLENETYIDKDGNTYRCYDKQDCETKAAYRLLEKLHKYFPKLGIIIGGDALYINQKIFDICTSYGWDYVMRYKEDGACSIQRNFDEIKEYKDGYYYANEVIFGELKKKCFNTVNVITKEDIDEKTGKVTEFKYITSLTISQRNKEEIFEIGRNRWKIENKGFNEQKNGVLNIKHIYTKDYTGTKNIYLLIQISHTLLTLLNCADCLVKAMKATKKEVSFQLIKSLTSKTKSLNFNKPIQLRLTPV